MSLEQYIQEVRNRENPRYATLSVKEERELAIKARNDPLARTDFVEHNLRLVISKVMEEYKTRYRLTDDEQWELIQAGNIALQKGIEDFQVRGDSHGRGYVKFSSFIYRKGLKWAMDRAILELRHIPLPEEIDSLRKAIYAVEKEYYTKHGTYPTDAQLVGLIHKKGITAKKIKEAREFYLNTQVTSSNVPIGEDGEEELADIIAGADGRKDADHLSYSHLKVLLVRHLEVLPSYERAILIDRYFHNLSPKTIAQRLGLPIDRVKQKEAKAMRVIRNSIKKDKSISRDIAAHLSL